MTFYETVIICILELISFVIGAKVGQHSVKGKDIKVNPLESIKTSFEDSKKKKAEIKKKEKLDAIMQNIDNYNGTGLGQRQIPRD